jgi:SAM-dependent methyltransferase
LVRCADKNRIADPNDVISALGTAAEWDASYREGRWNYLRDVSELPRYAVIAAYVQAFARGTRVLDVGCGEAILLRHLGPECISEYWGIDWALTALPGQRRSDVPSTILRADFTTFAASADTTFAAIIFNEVLYYCDSPVRVLSDYARLLTRGGILILSVCEQPGIAYGDRVSMVWDTVERSRAVQLHAVRLKDLTTRLSWQVRVLRVDECSPFDES